MRGEYGGQVPSLSEAVPVSAPKPEQYAMNELFVLSDVGMSTPTEYTLLTRKPDIVPTFTAQ
jgi:hypothetical protein